jgi:ubiquinone/menaquinone biosynthesis C-methylase UbiE
MIAAATAETPPGAIAFQLIETIERLNIPAGSQEGVICSSVLEYVSSPRAALAEMRRVLKPHGTLIASVPNTWSGIRLAQQAVRSVARVFGLHPYRYLEVSKHCYSRRGFVRLLESEGFRVEIISSFSPVAPRLVSLLGAGALWVAVASRTDRTSPLNSSV